MAMLSDVIQGLDLQINKLVYEKFMQTAWDSRYNIPVYQLEGINISGYMRQDSSLRQLDSVARMKTAQLEACFNRDSAYRAVIQMQSDVLGIKGADGEAARKQLRDICIRLEEEDPVCRQARSEQVDALFVRNLAVCRFVLDRFQQLGRLLSTAIIPYQLRESIECEQDIVQLKRERNVLADALRCDTHEYYKLKYGKDIVVSMPITRDFVD